MRGVIRFGDGGEAEVAVSKSQRRKSDVKVYKDFCDFYARLHLCRPCHNREKARGLGKYMCQKCHAIIEDQPLLFKNDPYHPDHFSCNNCGKELTWEARELKGELHCLPCHDKMGVPICGACRRPIEGHVVNAMGKQWHVE
ncbi:hypothetical protein CRUP_013405, partial [Coryphaenoides rupestris]